MGSPRKRRKRKVTKLAAIAKLKEASCPPVKEGTIKRTANRLYKIVGLIWDKLLRLLGKR